MKELIIAISDKISSLLLFHVPHLRKDGAVAIFFFRPLFARSHPLYKLRHKLNTMFTRNGSRRGLKVSYFSFLIGPIL